MMSAQHAQPWSADDHAEMERLVSAGLQAKAIRPSFPGRSERSVEARYKLVRKQLGLAQHRGLEPKPENVSLQTDEQVFASDFNYSVRRRIEAERGCRLLKQAMDRYHANRSQAA